MISSTIASTIAIILGLASSVAASPRSRPRQTSSELSLTTQLLIAETAIDRYQLLPNDEDFVFDFTKSQTGFANHKTFPALVGVGGAMVITTFEPCTMAAVHLHPRASELFAVTSGRIVTQMVPESGVVDADKKQRVIKTELGPKMATVFPMGAFHTQANLECEPATVVASFTSEDAGASLVAGETFALSEDTIFATFGESIAKEDIESIKNAIPQTAFISLGECAAKCGIKRRQD